MKKNNNIAIIFDDLTEFFVMRPAIDKLKKQGIPTDIIVPYDSGYNGLATHTFNEIKKFGYSPKKDVPKNEEYKILLTPYPGLDVVKRIKFVYHIRYPYGAISTKPIPTYLPDYHIEYDAIFSFNTYDHDFLGAYGSKIYTIPYWRYHNFKRHTLKTNDKPTLLILPTFGTDTSCINRFTDSAIVSIKTRYHIITKAHHATHFNSDNDSSLSILEKISDEFYNSDTELTNLLEKADIVLSDNSGAIFESICAGVPVALFADNLNSRHLGKINTPQYDFFQQGFFPFTDNPEKITAMLSSIHKYEDKQKQLRSQLFLKIPKDPTAPFIDTLKQFLESDPEKDYRKILHSTLTNEYKDNRQKVISREQEIEKLKKTIQELRESTSWKITEPLRKLKTWSENVKK